jgi:hypothetical protein
VPRRQQKAGNLLEITSNPRPVPGKRFLLQ